MLANRKELALLRGKRTPETLEGWAEIFGDEDRGLAQKYALAIGAFLGQGTAGEADYLGQLSPNTRKAYSFAVAEFFEWVASKYGRAVPPHLVLRKDAEDYVHWLANRPFSLAEEKLKDGDRAEALAVFEVIKKAGSADVHRVFKGLPETLQVQFRKEGSPYGSLSRKIRNLVTLDVVEATPTVEELRRDYPQAGITQFDDFDGKSYEEVFVYSVKRYEPLSRMSISLRLSALSTFWRSLMQGENATGGVPILKHNIWEDVKKRVSRGLSSVKKESSRKQKVPSNVVIQMLKHAPTDTMVQKRNKAILYLMVFAGLRTTELLRLRRGPSPRAPHFDGSEPPSLRVLRKGNKWMRLPYPPAALKLLIEFQADIEQKAKIWDRATPEEQELPEIRGNARYARLMQDDSPLFPPLVFWGANISGDYRKGMSRESLFMILRKVAEESGVPEEFVKKVHPHAIRHFSANAMYAGGKDLREIQALLGHSSVTTTEIYLDDVEGEQRLSGQAAILDYLEREDSGIASRPKEQKKRRQEKDVIDVTSVEVEGPPVPAPARDFREDLPPNEEPMAPDYEEPETQVVEEAPGIQRLDLEDTDVRLGEGLVAITDDTQDTIHKGIQTFVDGRFSAGAPDEVYSALESDLADHETVVFNRGGQDKERQKWLFEHYPKIPKDYGVGYERSLLPWFVKAKGNISDAGFFRGAPPFPVFSPNQITPDTVEGESMIFGIERLYEEFADSPIRGVGLVRWFGFFTYTTTKFLAAQAGRPPRFGAWGDIAEVGSLRTHKEEWLLSWFKKNSHTFRSSVDAMKRGVPRTGGDVLEPFLRSSFEGIDLIEQMPVWMTEDDPVHALHRDDPSKYKEFVHWLKNVTGQHLSVGRERNVQYAESEDKQLAAEIQQILVLFYEERDRLEQEKHKGSAVRRQDVIDEARENMRLSLIAYLVKAAGISDIGYSAKEIARDSTADFNRRMSPLFEKYEVPNPGAEKYRKISGVKKRIAEIVREVVPAVEADVSVFADSALFDPRWFRIDEKGHTLTIEEEAKQELVEQFGLQQDPLLLLRRAARAMFEARDKGYDKLWGIMMSYLSWIVPTGAQMEKEAVGIPTKGTSRGGKRSERMRWLETWTESMKELAVGAQVREGLEKKGKGTKALPGKGQELSELERLIAAQSLDMLDHAMAGFEVAAFASASGWEESPEELYLQKESGEDYYRNKATAFVRNGRDVYYTLGGEKARGFFKTDFFGGRDFKPNATPVYVSPGLVFDAKRRIAPATKLLPSPFRMIAAMQEGSK